jgi:two-component system sensor histidine kinase KdpD
MDKIKKKKGKLTIFTSYTPAAGKSYLMITRALEKRKAGAKVLVGFLNDSHRGISHMPKDEELYQELKAKHHSTDKKDHRHHKIKYSIKEILAENPDLVIMDEMGMHNINMDESTFVYEDVEKLLEAGIDVYSTANIKRFAGANPIFKQATGIGIRTTIPDKLLEIAECIVFVDRKPEDILKDYQENELFNERYRNSRIMKKNFQMTTLTKYRKISKRYLEKYRDKVVVVVR